MSGAYIEFGPWVDGGAPGISSAFLNPLETFLLSINSAAYDANISSNGSGVQTSKGQIVNGAIANNPTGVVLNGGTSGTATLYQDCTGNIKRVLIVESNFRTAGSAQTLALPTAFTKGAVIRTGFIDRISLLASTVAQSIAIITALSATALGSSTAETVMFGFGFGECLHAFDTVQFAASGAGANNGFIELIGQ